MQRRLAPLAMHFVSTGKKPNYFGLAPVRQPRCELRGKLIRARPIPFNAPEDVGCLTQRLLNCG
jgi:hypothetical protein